MVNLFPFFGLRRRGRSWHPRTKNILDLPYTKYNQRTMLPDKIPIGGKEVAPFVSIDESEWREAAWPRDGAETCGCPETRHEMLRVVSISRCCEGQYH